MRPKNLPQDFEQSIKAFWVRPDWYEEYWLEPKKTSQPAATKWRSSMSRFQFHLYAATVSGLAAFIRSRAEEAIRSLAHLQR